MSAKPTIAEVIPLVRSYRDLPGNGTGGSLHIVLDDGNIKDSDVKWCIKHAAEEGDEIGSVIGSLLLQMSKTQRKKLSNMFYSP